MSKESQSCMVAQKLRDLCRQWLKPEMWTGVSVVELILVQWFAHILVIRGRDGVLKY